MLNFISESEITERLLRRWSMSGYVLSDPICIHKNPKTKHEHWYGIGPFIEFDLDERKESEGLSWFDVRLPTKEMYEEVKEMLKQSCAKLRLEFKDV